MPDRRTHRGPDPRDRDAFAPSAWPRLRAAVADLSWLLSRGYAEVSALKLVGDRYTLTERQRLAVRRCACSDAALARRRRHRVAPSELNGQTLWLDGFNLLTTVEAALGGAVVLRGRDDCLRDLAGVHGTYRRVAETRPALLRIAEVLSTLGVGPCRWLLDSPVSNSGRLRGIMLQAAEEHGWPWQVELVFNPDPLLSASPEVVVSADSAILDRCNRWVNLAAPVIATTVPEAFVVDLAAGSVEAAEP